MYNRKLSVLDQIITQIDDALRTVSSDAPLPKRPSPANSVDDAELTQSERERAIGLMRVNHTGEICAQALYQGQALTAKLPDVREQMKEAASEATSCPHRPCAHHHGKA